MAGVTLAGGRQRELIKCNNLVLSESIYSLLGGPLINVDGGDCCWTTLSSDVAAELGEETCVCTERSGVDGGGEKRERLTGHCNPSFFSFLVGTHFYVEGMSRARRFYTDDIG